MVFKLLILLAFAAQTISPHITAGDKTNVIYTDYTKRLKHLHDWLIKEVKPVSKALLLKIDPRPPEPTPWGYQVLPKITKDAAVDENKKAESTSYSWPRTMKLITSEQARLDDLERKLTQIKNLQTIKDKLAVLETAASDYKELSDNQKTIDHHIQYNRFWQQEIFKMTWLFKERQVYHDKALERQLLLDSVKLKPDLEKSRKASQLLLEINNFVHKDFSIPSYLKLTQNGIHHTLHVPIVTDIEDHKFLKKLKDVIESRWKYSEPNFKFEVKVSIQKLKIKGLKYLDKMDINAHLNKFPKNAGIITTGSNSTYALQKKCVVLGPQDLSENVLAHEFGHILGFNDAYFRGYRDYAENGFEVLEIIPDPMDIMSMPGQGKVMRLHLDMILRQFSKHRNF